MSVLHQIFSVEMECNFGINNLSFKQWNAMQFKAKLTNLSLESFNC